MFILLPVLVYCHLDALVSLSMLFDSVYLNLFQFSVDFFSSQGLEPAITP